MIIYIDNDFRCHCSDDGTMRSIETDFFLGKCQEFIEGYRFIPSGETWIDSGRRAYKGETVFPYKPFRELDAAQREYERQQLEDMAAELADAKAALELLGVTEDA